MITREELEQALRSLLPIGQQEQATKLAHLLVDTLNKQPISDDNKSDLKTDLHIRAILESLSGQNIGLKEAIISFGAGTQTGEITIGDIAMGNIYRINIYPASTNENLQDKPLIPPSSRGSLAGQEKIEPLWQEAVKAFEESDLRKAELLFAQISKINPNYRNLQQYISQTQKEAMFLAFYRGLCDKEDSQWREVKRGLGMLEHWYPGYPDPHGLKNWVKQQEAKEGKFRQSLRFYEDYEYDSAIGLLEELVGGFPEYDDANQLLRNARGAKAEKEYREQIRVMKAREKEIHKRRVEETREIELAEKERLEEKVRLATQRQKEERQREFDQTVAFVMLFTIIIAIISCIGFFTTHIIP